MSDLTEGQLHALQNLSRTKAGGAVPSINIRDARVLVELGLAVRSRQGWDITPEGVRLLAPPPSSDNQR